MKWTHGLLAALALLAAGLPAASAAGPILRSAPAARAATAAMVVTPETGLVDDQTISLLATNASPDGTFVFTECSPAALAIVVGHYPVDTNADDGCEERRNTVVFSDHQGVATGTLAVNAVLDTATGTHDCRAEQCFVALFALHASGGPLIANLSFSPRACAAPGACQLPRLRSGGGRGRSSSGAGRSAATPGTPVSVPVVAGAAGDLAAIGAVTGPFAGSFPAPNVPVSPISGELLVRVAMDAPGTSWGPGPPSSVVVDVAVDGGNAQQLVLFRGATPFVYAGFAGPGTTGPHTVSVTVEPKLSTTAGPPAATVLAAQVQVVAPTNAAYRALAYAPVMYGRTTSALHDTPLVVSAGSTDLGGGATRLTYTVIWSHEDAGTGFIPFLLWGAWGRMTDIENAISFTVRANGSVTDAQYLWGGIPLTGYPDTQGAVSENDVAFTGSFDGHHPIIRDATGNNDFSQAGTSPFRFQQAPVGSPAAGEGREGVMDANPWTYDVMNDEITRWYSNISTDPRSASEGDAHQYAIVNLDASGPSIGAIGVDAQVTGDPTWYANDLGSGYPFVTGGGRTVVKLPASWQGHGLAALRLRVFPASAAGSIHVRRVEVVWLKADGTLGRNVGLKTLVTGGTPTVPTALALGASSATGGTTSRGIDARTTVTDALGEPLQGVPVTFTATGDGAAHAFPGCQCSSVTVLSGPGGVADAGTTAAPAAGTLTVTATTVDPATPAATLSVTVAGSGGTGSTGTPPAAGTSPLVNQPVAVTG